MGLTSLQVSMDLTDWLQGTIQDDSGVDSSSPSEEMLTCSRPMLDRRLRPPQDQALKCPRCESTHTKFCYYNNYSLSQPRYFCKTCRRYWTKGGTLRNIPVGGGCRKNKKVAKKPNDQSITQNPMSSQSQSSSSPPLLSHNPTHLQLSFPNFRGTQYDVDMFQNANPKPMNYDFMGNGDLGMVHQWLNPQFQHLGSPFGMSQLDGNGGNFMENCSQRLMLPYEYENQNAIDVKPNTKLLSLEWQDQGCSSGGNTTFGDLSNVGSWTGMMN